MKNTGTLFMTLILLMPLTASAAFRCDSVFTANDHEAAITELAGLYADIVQMNSAEKNLAVAEFKRKLNEVQTALARDLRQEVFIPASRLTETLIRQAEVDAQVETQARAHQKKATSWKRGLTKIESRSSPNLAFLDENTVVLTGNNKLLVYDVEAGQIVRNHPLDGANANSELALSPDRQTLFVDGHKTLTRFDLRSPDWTSHAVDTEAGAKTHNRVTPDGRLVLTYGLHFDKSGNFSSSLVIRKADTLEVLKTVETFRREGKKPFEISPSGNFVLLTDPKGRQQIVDLRTFEVTDFPERSRLSWKFWLNPRLSENRFRIWPMAAFLPGVRDRILFLNEDGEFIRYDVVDRTFEVLPRPDVLPPPSNPDPASMGFQVGPGGRHLLLWRLEGILNEKYLAAVVDLETGHDLGVKFPNLGSWARPVAFSPERGLVMFYGDGKVDTESRQMGVAVMDLDTLQIVTSSTVRNDGKLMEINPDVRAEFAPGQFSAAFGSTRDHGNFILGP